MEIYFAQIREDSRVEREVMQRKNPSKVAVIGSGGCTAFSSLSDEVENVYCIDLNPAQCALVELKKAGIRAFERAEFLAFIGETGSENRLNQYQHLRKDLPRYAQEFWDANSEAITSGINKCGVTEKFYAHISQQILANIYDKRVWDELFQCPDLAEQQKVYSKYFLGDKWRSQLLPLLSKTSHLQFFPAYMFAQAQEDDFGKFFLHQFEQELLSKPVKDNYFLSQFLFGKYLFAEAEGMPYYLTPEGYEQAKRNLEKLEIIPEAVDQFLKKQTAIEAFFLSNVFDWSTEESRTSICKSVLNAAAPNATVLYRNMLSEPQLPAFFSEKFRIDEELSAHFQKLERAMLYRKLTVGE